MGKLHDLSELGDLDGVRQLLDDGVSVDELDDSDETALHGAAAFGHTEVVRLLLERGAAVDQTDGDELWTALMAAAGNGHSDVVRLCSSTVRTATRRTTTARPCSSELQVAATFR